VYHQAVPITPNTVLQGDISLDHKRALDYAYLFLERSYERDDSGT